MIFIPVMEWKVFLLKLQCRRLRPNKISQYSTKNKEEIHKFGKVKRRDANIPKILNRNEKLALKSVDV
ncbi:tRNA pseudouridine(38/39) synthase [Armadillidium vulgare]|nr:hypothetical protein Avbf_05418 [Armadillidium vulgare]RXG60600.1 tRNA pseudouridine(38/39) synthase [Armadillidium vulgare]